MADLIPHDTKTDSCTAANTLSLSMRRINLRVAAYTLMIAIAIISLTIIGRDAFGFTDQELFSEPLYWILLACCLGIFLTRWVMGRFDPVIFLKLFRIGLFASLAMLLLYAGWWGYKGKQEFPSIRKTTSAIATRVENGGKYPPRPEIAEAKLGLEVISLGPGEKFGRHIPKNWYWHLKAPKNGVSEVDWEFLTQGKKYFDTDPREFKDGDVVTRWPDQDMNFVVRTSKLITERLEFKLLVTSSPISKEVIEKM